MATERGLKMAKQRFKPEEIILKLREIEIHQGKGMDILTACKQGVDPTVASCSAIWTQTPYLQ